MVSSHVQGPAWPAFSTHGARGEATATQWTQRHSHVYCRYLSTPNSVKRPHTQTQCGSVDQSEERRPRVVTAKRLGGRRGRQRRVIMTAREGSPSRWAPPLARPLLGRPPPPLLPPPPPPSPRPPPSNRLRHRHHRRYCRWTSLRYRHRHRRGLPGGRPQAGWGPLQMPWASKPHQSRKRAERRYRGGLLPPLPPTAADAAAAATDVIVPPAAAADDLPQSRPPAPPMLPRVPDAAAHLRWWPQPTGDGPRRATPAAPTPAGGHCAPIIIL